jgi:hypothetical protein
MTGPARLSLVAVRQELEKFLIEQTARRYP